MTVNDGLKFFAVIAAAALCIIRCPGATKFRGVEYSGRRQFDLSVPDGKGPHPCVIYFHGGAWKNGDRRKCPDAKIFLQRGIAFASVDYRLTDGGRNPFPAQIIDCREAVAFLHRHAAEYGLDTRRFAVAGGSAGGHLASLVALTAGSDPFRGGKSADDPGWRIAAAVDFFGPSDLVTIGKETAVRPGGLKAQPQFAILRDFFGTDDLEEMARLAAGASPLTYISGTPPPPPFFIAHSTGDPVVPYSQSERLAKRLESVGTKVDFRTYGLKRHAVPPEAWSAALDFLTEVFRLKSSDL